jgi:hypothetical protein
MNAPFDDPDARHPVKVDAEGRHAPHPAGLIGATAGN